MGNKKENRPEKQGQRVKMPRQERAKQFMPFDALKGFREALRKKEEEMNEK